MELNLDSEVLKAYGYTKENIKITQIGTGLINRTYLLSPLSEKIQYILQNINTSVFKDPQAIADNLQAIAKYLAKKYPDYLFIKPISTVSGNEMAYIKYEHWRMLPFVPNTVSLDVLTNEKQAYEAAKQFGKLSRLLNDFDASALKPTIPGFHDLALRYEQFTLALTKTSKALKGKAKPEIDDAIRHKYILDYYKSFAHRPDFPNRVMHHDTKISNVLLDAKTFQGVCVIDLDTIMPGKFISDLGDMMRTYLCAFSENESDLSKVKIRLHYFEAMVKGYLSEMKSILTELEKELILFSGRYIIYMQALRFLTDFLNGNIYYPTSYAEQNLDRAKNQFKLLHEISVNEKELQDIIEENLV
ncbi:aminoglycoside phosphotransferase family protein [Pedobacter frigidisoli]|uniref:Aminoglycoside phosphotransferase family protein n=1 Tax=Pedobacter frigidisoli TaxID=2530455 RepID=A0A4V2MMV1_9SPHI|nr:aminoglycoside phosphotransferase family protein [Pedobacter frigidisoli]TCD10172.1 aminoglycoside phosphotransferase family protein [Pedobacter frigidisoli]